MNFTGFYGNAPIKAVLSAHPFHAYLIEGPEGSGKHTLANLIANALVCEGENPPCGTCRQCYKIRNHCHPDVIDLPCDLSVEDLRRVLADIILVPNDAAYKIYRIDKAEKMLPAAQNLLLKTLEEPPRYAVFLLLCQSREGVLETVRSRCQTLSLAPLPEEEIKQYFLRTYGNYDDKARRAAALSAGFLGKAIAYYENGAGEVLQKCEDVEKSLSDGNGEAVFAAFSFSDREELTDFYSAFSLHLRRKMRQCEPSLLPFYARLDRAWRSAAEAMKTNVNVKFWNVNLARLLLNAADAPAQERKSL